jgi:hypothetical protein
MQQSRDSRKRLGLTSTSAGVPSGGSNQEIVESAGKPPALKLIPLKYPSSSNQEIVERASLSLEPSLSP